MQLLVLIMNMLKIFDKKVIDNFFTAFLAVIQRLRQAQAPTGRLKLWPAQICAGRFINYTKSLEKILITLV
jgi:hypothetical protein